jgi:NADH dehydrogenase (ubiquinone) 1 beta subcomplex subunit 3
MPSIYRDPWAAREAWRKHPIFSHRFMFRNFVPGIGLGVGAFVAYFAVDRLSHPGNIEKLKEEAKKQKERKPLFG